jgi:uncharacterized membrane protein YgcG
MNDSPPDVSTGFLAFLAFAFLALALWFLMRNMNARMRRMSYRQQRANRGRDDQQAGPYDTGVAGDRRPDGDGPADPDGSADPGSGSGGSGDSGHSGGGGDGGGGD